MNMTWDLEILYKGYDDPKYISDYQKVLEIIKKFNELIKNKNFKYLHGLHLFRQPIEANN